jgi:hypothetical protein
MSKLPPALTVSYKAFIEKEQKTVAVKQIKVKQWAPARVSEVLREYDIIR